MVNEKQPGEVLSEEGTSGATLSSPVLKKRGRSCASHKATKLPYSLPQLILQVFENCSARKGLSLAALKKHLTETGYNVRKNNSRLKRELNNLVSHGLLIRVTGTGGASGSFKFSRQTKKTGKTEPEEKASAARKSPKVNKDPPKKTQKKQRPPVNKPQKSQRKSTANSGKNQLNNHPTGSNRNVSVKKRPRRR